MSFRAILGAGRDKLTLLAYGRFAAWKLHCIDRDEVAEAAAELRRDLFWS